MRVRMTVGDLSALHSGMVVWSSVAFSANEGNL